MEALIKEMQDPETGVPVRSQKLFLSVIPSAFMGYDLVEWLMDRFNLDETSNVEAINLANQLCQYGYFFPVNDLKVLVLKDDSSLYRFQSPYYWPWQTARVAGSGSGAPSLGPDNIEYAIYLVKRTLRNKQRHALEEYEQEALANLKKNLAAKWDFITMQAEEQVRLAKDRKKGDKIVSDSQERAYWRVARPPPGVPSALEPCPIPVRARHSRPKKRTIEQLTKEIEHLKSSADRTRVKTSIALEALLAHSETFAPYDPWLTPPQPSNPWISDDTLFWQINSPLVEVPSEKRVQRWALSIEELLSDPTGLQEFTSFLRKEYSHENIRFFLAVMDLRKSSNKQIPVKLQEIYEEFLKPGAPCEINIDGATADKVAEGLRAGSRYALDHAADHVYGLLLKKDCYPRFIRSDHFQRLLTEGRNVHQKKTKFFNFGGGQVKKKPGSSSGSGAGGGAALSRRRGSDRSLSGSAHELAVCAAQAPRGSEPPPYSHSQSNLCDIPRDPMDDYTDEAVPWESTSREAVYGARRRQDSAADSGSSSSELSAVASASAERTRRLPQQSTLDGGLRGAPPPLRRLSAVEPRHLAPLASPPHSPRAPRPAPAPAHPPHPTPTISVSSAPEDDSPGSERRSLAHTDEPSSVFASADVTPTDPVRPIAERSFSLEKTVSPSDSRTDVVKVKCESPARADSRDSDDSTRQLSREPSTTRELSPASCKDSCKIGDLPGKDDTTPDTATLSSSVASVPSTSGTIVSTICAPVPSTSGISTVPSPSGVSTAPSPTPERTSETSSTAPTSVEPLEDTATTLQEATTSTTESVTSPLAASDTKLIEPPGISESESSILRQVAPLAVGEDIVDDDNVDKVPSPPARRPSEDSKIVFETDDATKQVALGESKSAIESDATKQIASAKTATEHKATKQIASGEPKLTSESDTPKKITSGASKSTSESDASKRTVSGASKSVSESDASKHTVSGASKSVSESEASKHTVSGASKSASESKEIASKDSKTAPESDATKRIAHKDVKEDVSSVSDTDIVKLDNKGERQRNDICPWEDE
ncbi:hypothetical protein O0L34_g7332 [Tuta absoluta]|nr:hypothetical protein O0L34_g7332 [Tuta absoluta]